MIINDKYLVPITNRNVTVFKSLGYEVKSGIPHLIKLEDCPGKVPIICKCDKCSLEYTVTKAKLNETNSKFCKEHRWEVYSEGRKEYWNSEKGLEIRKAKGPKISKNRRGKGLKSEDHWAKQKKYHKYCMDVKRFQYAFKDEISLMPNFSKIAVAGVKGGYQLDHRISRRYGFDNGIHPKIIGHICNLQIIPWELNRRKSDSNDLELETLNSLIEKYYRNQ